MHRVLDRQLAKQNPPGLCALAIMTKAPRAGAVKTRLQPPLTAAEAAELNICFLRDTAEAIAVACSSDSGWSTNGIDADKGPLPTRIARGVGVFTPAGSEKDYVNILPPDFDLLPQRGQGFGERLLNAAADLLRAGFESCCLINSDSPTVTADAFREAAAQLQREDDCIVLGPADDGGYYLIGMRKLHARLFDDIDWSTGRVFAQTIERAEELRVRVHTLPSFFDVDDRATLHRLCGELLGKELSGTVAPATAKFLRDMIAQEGRDRIWPG